MGRGRATALFERCEAELDRSASVRLLRELSSGEVGAEAFGRYLAVEHDFVRTAARLAGYCLWQQPDWSLAERHAHAVADLVGGLGRHLAQHLRTHVLELVGELDLLRDRHAVLGDARCAEALVNHHVAALGAERHLHCVGEDVHAA